MPPFHSHASYLLEPFLRQNQYLTEINPLVLIIFLVALAFQSDLSAVKKRHAQGWVDEIITDVNECVARIRFHKERKAAVSIAYHGNVVTLWERLAEEKVSKQCTLPLIIFSFHFPTSDPISFDSHSNLSTPRTTLLSLGLTRPHVTMSLVVAISLSTLLMTRRIG